ncbi:MAG: signal recognition particle-docking protein FtsY [Symbiobacteriaceae bacterium]|nr:signal recognition particle-docking protein FtsY [Symbiobacteriaceae bacterium]
MSLFNRLREGLQKTKETLVSRIDQLLANFTSIDEAFFEELEEVLLGADVGIATTGAILESLREKVRLARIEDASAVRELLQQVMTEMLGTETLLLNLAEGRLNIVLIVGVNGVGKTTLIGKMAYQQTLQGKKVLLAAADTFRAAAIEQLTIWAERAKVDLIHHQEGSDPAAVVFDAINAAKSRQFDLLLIDTAGRLHNKQHLMEEMRKIVRIIRREVPDAPHEVLLVLDATTGQNAIQQAKAFNEVCDVSALALTKLDGTAKGGIVFSIAELLKIPVKLIGVGEGVEDLREFDPQEFVAALFGE